jgi:hypothetical protein
MRQIMHIKSTNKLSRSLIQTLKEKILDLDLGLKFFPCALEPLANIIAVNYLMANTLHMRHTNDCQTYRQKKTS